MKYILKNGIEVESIPIGKSSVQIGEISPDGYLKICDRGPNTGGSRGANVICKCKYGNYTMIKLLAFKNGTTKSCGCYGKAQKKEIMSKIGKQSKAKDYSTIFNPFYLFLEKTEEKDKNNSFYWKIQCKNCGKIYKEVPAYLISSSRRKGNNPCECWKHLSKGVLKIKQILTDNQITFVEEKTFNNCLSPKGNHLKFDFWINNKYLLEYDGEQHFLPEKFSNNQDGNQKLTLQKEYDIIKNSWSIKNNIPLIRIPYTHYKNIILDDLIPNTSKFLVKEEINE